MENIPNKKELPKGTCDSCWGKKFYSQMVRETGMGDFPGDPDYDSGSHIENKPCSKCNGTGKYLNPPKEFPQGKENYCPKCYFVDGKVVLRTDCKGHTTTPKEEEKYICMNPRHRETGLKFPCKECKKVITPQPITEDWNKQAYKLSETHETEKSQSITIKYGEEKRQFSIWCSVHSNSIGRLKETETDDISYYWIEKNSSTPPPKRYRMENSH